MLLPRQVSPTDSVERAKIIFKPVLFCQWILNIAYAVIGQPMADFVRERVNSRNVELADKHDYNVAIDPAFLAIIKSSTAVSTTKGSSAHLCRIGAKRPRTRAEIDEFRALQENQLQAILAKDETIDELRRAESKSKSKLQKGAYAEALVKQMLEAGYLTKQSDGSYVPR